VGDRKAQRGQGGERTYRGKVYELGGVFSPSIKMRGPEKEIHASEGSESEMLVFKRCSGETPPSMWPPVDKVHGNP